MVREYENIKNYKLLSCRKPRKTNTPTTKPAKMETQITKPIGEYVTEHGA